LPYLGNSYLIFSQSSIMHPSLVPVLFALHMQLASRIIPWWNWLHAYDFSFFPFFVDRHDWSGQLLTASGSTSVPFFSLLETVACLINPKLPWNCKVVVYLQRQKIYCLFQGIIISVPVSSVSISLLWSSIRSSHLNFLGHLLYRCLTDDPTPKKQSILWNVKYGAFIQTSAMGHRYKLMVIKLL
jgi:hypothetical protein